MGFNSSFFDLKRRLIHQMRLDYKQKGFN